MWANNTLLASLRRTPVAASPLPRVDCRYSTETVRSDCCAHRRRGACRVPSRGPALSGTRVSRSVPGRPYRRIGRRNQRGVSGRASGIVRPESREPRRHLERSAHRGCVPRRFARSGVAHRAMGRTAAVGRPISLAAGAESRRYHAASLAARTHARREVGRHPGHRAEPGGWLATGGRADRSELHDRAIDTWVQTRDDCGIQTGSGRSAGAPPARSASTM